MKILSMILEAGLTSQLIKDILRTAGQQVTSIPTRSPTSWSPLLCSLELATIKLKQADHGEKILCAETRQYFILIKSKLKLWRVNLQLYERILIV